ncbi:putative regulator protein, GGDEF domain; putative membrane protein [Deinococcus deserti VCD115]|uniref:Putative regulator protein, GGDEF domain putative membrane protein n=2 Tax=Deinococcus TaxID=1298 RepID=C1D1C4_DEIDV|nr:putative regulator protein, GGDEF domain; putative membrane protein [Deinococcus deserti VCD115]
MTLSAGLICLYRPDTLKIVVGILLALTMFSLPIEVRWHIDHRAVPMNMFVWLMVYLLCAYVVFGTRVGGILNAVSLGIMLLALVSDPPTMPMLVSSWLTGLIVLSVLGVLGYSIIHFIEINLLLHAQDNVRLRAARLDALTGVYGRGAIEEELKRSMHTAREANTAVSIVVTDIDHFKSVNDLHGHMAGDDVLRAVAKCLRRNVRRIGGVVGRWGGEEFVVLLPGISRTDALVVAEQLRRELSAVPLGGLPITASFGVAAYRGTGDSPEKMFSRADLAMYEAKRAGRNAVR